MKAQVTLLLITAALCLSAIPAVSQGDFTPPGPPGPTMKTLDQVEPSDRRGDAGRGTPFSEVVITNTGSYYLSGNLEVSKTHGIYVDAVGVTLDLNGFGDFLGRGRGWFRRIHQRWHASGHRA